MNKAEEIRQQIAEDEQLKTGMVLGYKKALEDTIEIMKDRIKVVENSKPEYDVHNPPEGLPLFILGCCMGEGIGIQKMIVELDDMRTNIKAEDIVGE